jgi:curli biogenesis system outer membrane secretion channel CsgG
MVCDIYVVQIKNIAMKKKFLLMVAVTLLFGLTANAQRKTVVTVPVVNEPVQQDVKFIKRKVAIGRFSNETQYAKGIFYDKANDPMGKQALDILSAKLAASGKFLLLERSDLATLLEEAKKGEGSLSTIGADYMIIGSITEFGRKNTGKSGVFTNTNVQTVEAAVAIRLVDVSTGLIIYSDEGKGQAELTSKTTMGVGGKAGYDATLSDKAISEAIGQLVENIINKCTDKPWRTYFLSYDNDGILIGGGASQGVKVGDSFAVKTKGKKVKNPQTGVMIELPGKTIGSVTVLMSGGDTPETEFSAVDYQGDAIDNNKLENYYIEEVK